MESNIGESHSNAVPMIETQEELDALLAGSEHQADDGDHPGGEDGKQDPPAGADGADPKKKDEKKPSIFNQPAGDEGAEGDDSEKENDDDNQEGTYGNILEYLNEKNSLDLNVEAIPKDLTREQEAEVVSTIIQRVTEGANQAVAKYKHIEELLQNPDTALVIKGISEGKTLKQIAQEYQTSPAGMDSEALVADDFKKKFPTLKDELIKKMVEGTKQSGEFEVIAESIREARKSDEINAAKQQEVLTAKERAETDKQRAEDIKNFQQKLVTVKNVYGVPLDEQMRTEIFTAATERDKEGLTYIEKALQTDDGIILATLGLLHLQKLITAKASTVANKKNKSFMDKILDTPERLQGGSERGQETEFDIAAINKW